MRLFEVSADSHSQSSFSNNIQSFVLKASFGYSIKTRFLSPKSKPPPSQTPFSLVIKNKQRYHEDSRDNLFSPIWCPPWPTSASPCPLSLPSPPHGLINYSVFPKHSNGNVLLGDTPKEPHILVGFKIKCIYRPHINVWC